MFGLSRTHLYLHWHLRHRCCHRHRHHCSGQPPHQPLSISSRLDADKRLCVLLRVDENQKESHKVVRGRGFCRCKLWHRRMKLEATHENTTPVKCRRQSVGQHECHQHTSIDQQVWTRDPRISRKMLQIPESRFNIPTRITGSRQYSRKQTQVRTESVVQTAKHPDIRTNQSRHAPESLWVGLAKTPDTRIRTYMNNQRWGQTQRADSQGPRHQDQAVEIHVPESSLDRVGHNSRSTIRTYMNNQDRKRN